MQINCSDGKLTRMRTGDLADLAAPSPSVSDDAHAIRKISKILCHPVTNEWPLLSRILNKVSKDIFRISISVVVGCLVSGSA